MAHDRLFRPAGTLLESDSVEMAERSRSLSLRGLSRISQTRFSVSSSLRGFRMSA
jgi:hypothetical protein